jgi:hypothetical protein
VPEQGSIVCPDCGAAYQCTPEQSGKLLHCKCGRYLVAGGNNHKSPTADVPAPTVVAKSPATAVTAPPMVATPKVEPTLGVKSPALSKPKPVEVMPVTPKVGNTAAESHESKSYLSVAAAIVAILVVGAGFFLLRPMAAVKASKPQVIEATAPAATAQIPCSTAPFRLENGTAIAHSLLGSGMGKLEIENAMPTDAVVRVTGSANLTVVWIYVQQGQKVSLNDIPLGTHRVLISSGSDWNSQTLHFKCNDVYAELEKPLDYTDRREDDRTTYSAYRLVLGKQRTAMITKEDFFTGYIGGAK